MDRVRDASRHDVAHAAAVPSTYGSARTEAALCDGFSLWSKSWEGRGHLLDDWQPRTDETTNARHFEEAYSSALIEGRGSAWTSHSARVQSLCQSTRCRARAAEAVASVISIRALPESRRHTTRPVAGQHQLLGIGIEARPKAPPSFASTRQKLAFAATHLARAA